MHATRKRLAVCATVVILLVGISLAGAVWLCARDWPSLVDPCAGAPRPRDGPPLLPRIIHQIWHEEAVPRKYDAWRAKWREFFPTHEHRLWTVRDIRALLAEEYAWFLPIWEAYPLNVNRFDSARVFILHRFGGAYADMDFEPLADFWKLLPDDVPSFAGSPYHTNEERTNAFMASPPAHPFWVVYMAVLIERARVPPPREAVLWVTATQALDEAARRYAGGTQVLPAINFHRLPPHNATMLLGWMRLTGQWLTIPDTDADARCAFARHHAVRSWGEEFALWRAKTGSS